MSALHLTCFPPYVLSAIFLDSETFKTIACAIAGSRLDYVNSILTGISSCNIHRLHCVQNFLARVVTRLATNTTSAVNTNCLPIQQRINFKLATLVHHSLHNAGPQYLSSLLHTYTPSLTLCIHFFPLSLVSTLLLPLLVFDMLALLFGIPSIIISDLFTLHCLQIQSKNSSFLWCKHFWPLTILSTRF